MYRSYREYLRQQRITKMKVLSLEQMHQLKELGVAVKPKGMCLMYTSDSSDNYYLKYGESTCEDDVVAFGLQNIIELLPKQIINCNEIYLLKIIPISNEVSYIQFNSQICADITKYPLRVKKSDNLFDSLFEMLIWVIKNGYLKTK